MMKRTIVRITESDLHCIIKESVLKCLNEEYGKWFQTEENGIDKVNEMIADVADGLSRLDSMSPSEVWEVVRKLGYINHSAFKVRPGMWEKYPDEMLSDEDYALNQTVYSFKKEALRKLVGYYIKHGYDVSADEKRSMIAFREPNTGIRQITFHVGKDDELANEIERADATWDGVKQAHHYTDDDSYTDKRNEFLNRA